MAAKTYRVCAYCFRIQTPASFPPDRNTKDGIAHYCSRCVAEIADDNRSVKSTCALCNRRDLINRRVCLSCKSIVISVNRSNAKQQLTRGERLQIFALVDVLNRYADFEEDSTFPQSDSFVIANRCQRHNIRSVALGCQGLLIPSALEMIWLLQGGCCFYTGKPITLNDSHIDHIYPLSRGGDNNVFNVCFVHKTVNVTKHAKTLKEFCSDAELNYQHIRSRLVWLRAELEALGYRDVA